MAHDSTDLHRQLAELRATVAEQQRVIDMLVERVDDPPEATTSTRSDPACDPPDTGGVADRRRFFRLAGATAAGVVGAAVLDGALPTAASAADGDPLVIGSGSNTGASPTTLDVTGTTRAYGLGVLDNTTTAFTDSRRPAMLGEAAGTAFDTGVAGAAGGGIGIFGLTGSGEAVAGVAEGPGVGAALQGGRAAAQLFGSNDAPPARSSTHQPGELDVDVDGDLWWCVAAGTPGTWRKLAGPATAGALHVLPATQRVYDSRPGFDPTGVVKGPLAPNGERVVDCTLAGAVPAGAVAAMVNLTIVSASPQGFLAAFRNGITWPGSSSVNWDHSNETSANSAVVALDANAQFRVRASDVVDYIVDVIGYYR